MRKLPLIVLCVCLFFSKKITPQQSLRFSAAVAEERWGKIHLPLGDTFCYFSDREYVEHNSVLRNDFAKLKWRLDGTSWYVSHVSMSAASLVNPKRNHQIDCYSKKLWSILPISQKIWLSSAKGLLFFDRVSRQVKPLEQFNGFDALRTSEVYRMVEVKAGTLFLLYTSSGIYELHPEKGVQARYWTGGVGKYYLPVNDIRHFYSDGSGGYWLATSKGLQHWNWLSGSTQLHTVREGLPCNNLFCVYPDEFGFLWIMSDQGLIQLQINTGKHRLFKEEDGIALHYSSSMAHFKSIDGQIFLMGSDGTIWFQPKDFRDDFDRWKDARLSSKDEKITSMGRFECMGDLQEFYENRVLESWESLTYLSAQLSARYTELMDAIISYLILAKNDSVIPSCLENENQHGALPFRGEQIGTGTKVLKAQLVNSSTSFSIKDVFSLFSNSWLKGSLLLSGLIGLGFIWRKRIGILNERQNRLGLEVQHRTGHQLADSRPLEYRASQLNEQNLETTRLMTNLMQELRTPLSLIVGPLERYQRQSSLSQGEDSLLKIAVSNANRMLDLINDAQLFQSSVEGRIRLKSQSLEVDQFVRSMMGEFSPIARKKGLYLQVESHLTPRLMIQVDVEGFRRIIWHLVSNALKYTVTGGVVVRLEEFDNAIQLQVVDTGRGVYPDDMPVLFDRYFKTSRPDAPLEGGIGIGLSICKILVEAMNGTIGVLSSWGGGSTFWVKLPKTSHNKKEEDQADFAPLMEPVPQSSYRPKLERAARKGLSHILLVEASTEFQEYLVSVLAPHYRVTVAPNGAEALHRLSSEKLPDLLMMDLVLPGMDGFQLLERIQATPELCGVPIILLSANNSAEEEQRALELGVTHYLCKPYHEQLLLERIQTVLLEKSSHLSLVEGANALCLQDQLWLQKLEDLVFQHMGETGFSVDYCARLMLLSRSAFFMEVKRLTGMTPNQYIQEARLQKGRMLIEMGQCTSLKKLVQELGVKDERYYSKLYKQRYGQSVQAGLS
jgi:signal transduction histidine kinase/CheY-like chemotaxis protein